MKSLRSKSKPRWGRPIWKPPPRSSEASNSRRSNQSAEGAGQSVSPAVGQVRANPLSTSGRRSTGGISSQLRSGGVPFGGHGILQPRSSCGNFQSRSSEKPGRAQSLLPWPLLPPPEPLSQVGHQDPGSNDPIQEFRPSTAGQGIRTPSRNARLMPSRAKSGRSGSRSPMNGRSGSRAFRPLMPSSAILPQSGPDASAPSTIRSQSDTAVSSRSPRRRSNRSPSLGSVG